MYGSTSPPPPSPLPHNRKTKEANIREDFMFLSANVGISPTSGTNIKKQLPLVALVVIYT